MTTTRPARWRERRWFRLVWLVPALLVLAAIFVLVARWLRDQPAVHDFIVQFPGTADLPADAPAGIPAWLAWQHFLSSFFLLLIIRTGWQVRTTRKPAAYWTRRNTGPFRTTSAPKRISIELWLHQSLDALWVLNGVVFIVLLFATGQWMRIVPTTWDVVPHAISAGLQYASLEWPTENGWINYNSLQLLAYFVTVFLAAPLAIATGVRMSGLWPRDAARLNRLYPIELARAVHFPVMLYFVLFIVVHLTLVLATGAVRNLNHMYGGRDDESWVGFAFFGGSLAIMAVGWVLARPVFLRPAARLTGTLSR